MNPMKLKPLFAVIAGEFLQVIARRLLRPFDGQAEQRCSCASTAGPASQAGPASKPSAPT